MSKNICGFAAALVMAWGAAGCNGPKGPTGNPGTPAMDRGGIVGTIKDPLGNPVTAASVETYPATVTTQTSDTGVFLLSLIPVGVYNVLASKTGYTAGLLANVGVGGGASTQVSLVLAPVVTTGPAVVSGTVLGRQGPPSMSVPVTGATVCIEGTTLCATTDGSGAYSVLGVAPGFVYVSAYAPGYLTGETRDGTFVAPGATASGADITLSGRPPDSATYVGADMCVSCHSTVTPGLVASWQDSGHFKSFARVTRYIDLSGWPAAPTTCGSYTTADSGVYATDPTSGLSVDVLLVRWSGACPGGATFAMAFDSVRSGVFNPGADTVIAVTGTKGGVGSAAGQCGDTGILPFGVTCSADYVESGPYATSGAWQQEFLVAIGPGVTKPAWVTWDTTGTPSDLLVLPAAWNQRTRSWVSAPDFNPTRSGTFSQNCSGCHEVGVSLGADAQGNVQSYSAAWGGIGCEKCHGPGSAHVSALGNAQFIINPGYLTAQGETEVCGQCHSEGVSANPPGGFPFPYRAGAGLGGGNFVPGVDALSDFYTSVPFGGSAYWPLPATAFPMGDHLTYEDFEASVHNNNPYEKVTCARCHNPHGGRGGPYSFEEMNDATGDDYVFQGNSRALRTDAVCLSCHAAHGPFANLSLEEVARYHVSAGGTIQKNGAALSVSASDQAAAANLVASVVSSHMLQEVGMLAYFDPTGTASGLPVGRCSACHMAKTSMSATFFSDVDDQGRTANVMGDIASHTFNVALPQMSVGTWSAAGSWSEVMPSACGSCHAEYRQGK